VDRFEIVTEYSALSGGSLWFDNIQVTNLDTALVYETGEFVATHPPFEALHLSVLPNPVSDYLMVKTDAPEEIDWQLIDLNGRVARQGIVRQGAMIDLGGLAAGQYYFIWTDGKQTAGVEKLVKY